ncbi:hypothetical protein ILUMI_26418 [Ignelater luminosus]|uniref:Peptidase S1 domain-containing protein n=1 Tax=Ignelater luminosus TaxID=2038154 RepID=A0A8K0C809_IGNLU|nr:hypothetical protein ILUMI_26418 [Ignelater luminosus]
MKIVSVLLFGIICVQHQTSAASFGGHEGFFGIGRNTFDTRVIGGSNAERHQFPYMVALHNQGRHTCGASVVSPTWVVTAAHCCDKNMGLNCATTQVVAGQLHQFENHLDVQKASVAKVVIHPQYYYNGTFIDHDITLLKLASKLVFSVAVQPVKLPSANQVFTQGWLSGWGVYQRPPTLPVTLQYLKMDVITNNECDEILKHFEPYEQLPLIDSMVCAMPPSKGPETGCNGDSGGPLADDGVLIGVTSWAVNCGTYKENAPTVFTVVNKYLDFINAHVDDLPLRDGN